jgi:myo-inositol-1(or 4)-monophosphatase
MVGNYLQLANEAAKEAGAILLEYWSKRSSLEISTKRPGDFVSKADLSAEQSLKLNLLSGSDGLGWLGEETEAKNHEGGRWIVDPLDGTTNFLKGIPHWAVSVGLELGGELQLGVIHNPLTEETFSAEVGDGATTDFSTALFGTGVPFGTMSNIKNHTDEIARLMPHCAGVRRMGAASLDLAYVACGRLDGFWERRLQLWDIAAGLVILRESGGVVSGWTAEEEYEKTGSIISCNPSLYDQFFNLITADN